MRITSPAFDHQGDIPPKYTAQGDDTSPPLAFSGIPPGTKSLALLVYDLDVPDPAHPRGEWDHWTVWNIPPSTQGIRETDVPAHAVQGRNGWGRHDYGGPNPPIGKHRYFFDLYALDIALDLPATSGRHAVLAAMQGHVLATAQLIGRYQRR